MRQKLKHIPEKKSDLSEYHLTKAWISSKSKNSQPKADSNSKAFFQTAASHRLSQTSQRLNQVTHYMLTEGDAPQKKYPVLGDVITRISYGSYLPKQALNNSRSSQNDS